MTIYTLVDFLTGIIEAIIIFIMLNSFLESKKTFPKVVYVIGIIVLALLINVSNHIFHFTLLNALGMITVSYTHLIAIPEQSKNLFMMSEDELNALSEEISGNIGGLAYQLLGAMMGNEAF